MLSPGGLATDEVGSPSGREAEPCSALEGLQQETGVDLRDHQPGRAQPWRACNRPRRGAACVLGRPCSALEGLQRRPPAQPVMTREPCSALEGLQQGAEVFAAGEDEGRAQPWRACNVRRTWTRSPGANAVLSPGGLATRRLPGEIRVPARRAQPWRACNVAMSDRSIALWAAVLSPGGLATWCRARPCPLPCSPCSALGGLQPEWWRKEGPRIPSRAQPWRACNATTGTGSGASRRAVLSPGGLATCASPGRP